MTAPSTEPAPRRRTVAVAAAVAAAVLLLGTVLAMTWPDRDTAREAAPGTPVFATSGASASVPASPSPTAGEVTPSAAASSPVAAPSPAPARTTTPRATPRTSPKTTKAPAPTCSPKFSVYATVPTADWVVTFKAGGHEGAAPRFCGTRQRVFWAVYVDGPNDKLYRYDSGVSYLDQNHLTWAPKMAVHDCAGSWYYGKGDVAIPETIPVSQRSSVFGRSKIGWDDDGNACS